MSDIQTLMRTANPVPDAASEFGKDDLDALLLLTRRRSTEMDAKEMTKAVEKDPRSRRSGWYAAATAFGLILVLIGSVVLLNRGTDSEIPPATTPSTTTQPSTTTEPSTTTHPTTTVDSTTVDAADQALLDGFVAALNAGDLGTAAALVSPGAIVSIPFDEVTYARDVFLEELAFVSGRGTTTRLSDCRRSGERILCRQSRSGVYEDIVYRGESQSNVWFTIDGAQILQIEEKCQICPDHNRFDAFVAWVQTKDPDAASTLGALVFPHVDTGGTTEAWREYGPEWLQEMGDG